MAGSKTAVSIKLNLDDYNTVERMAHNGCDTGTIAHYLGINRAELYKKMHTDRELGRRYKKGRAAGNEVVFGQLRERCNKGDTAAIIFHLKTRCNLTEGDKSRNIMKKVVEYVKAHQESQIDKDILVEELEEIADLELA